MDFNLFGLELTKDFFLALGKIIWINILLSGDNAVVIALACRSLAPEQRKWGIILGAGAAVLLRIIFTVFVAQLMQYPYLKLIGGLLLLWIAVKLLTDETDESSIKESHTIWSAVQTVVIADIVMSLDNVVAIAAAAKGSTALIVFGLVISVPLIPGLKALVARNTGNAAWRIVRPPHQALTPAQEATLFSAFDATGIVLPKVG